MSKKLIFVVEDDASIGQLYEYTFDSSDFQVRIFDSAEEMFEAIKTELPDLIIMDLMLPGMDGITAISQLKNQPETMEIPVIIISANGTETVKVRGLNIGAEDYIEKPFGVLELVARVKRVLKRQETAYADSITVKDLVIDLKKHTVTVKDTKVELTPKEFEILNILASAVGAVVKREEIFNAVWGESFYTESRTLDIHVNSLRKKLKDASGEEYISTIRGVGYTIV